MEGQQCAIALAMSSLMSLRPAMVMVSRLGQLVTTASTKAEDSWGRKRGQAAMVHHYMYAHTGITVWRRNWN